jgi:hypothetical protein
MVPRHAAGDHGGDHSHGAGSATVGVVSACEVARGACKHLDDDAVGNLVGEG